MGNHFMRASAAGKPGSAVLQGLNKILKNFRNMFDYIHALYLHIATCHLDTYLHQRKQAAVFVSKTTSVMVIYYPPNDVLMTTKSYVLFEPFDRQQSLQLAVSNFHLRRRHPRHSSHLFSLLDLAQQSSHFCLKTEN
jgi:hypothetical protein